MWPSTEARLQPVTAQSEIQSHQLAVTGSRIDHRPSTLKGAAPTALSMSLNLGIVGVP